VRSFFFNSVVYDENHDSAASASYDYDFCDYNPDNGTYINDGINNAFIQIICLYKHNILIVNIFSFYRDS